MSSTDITIVPQIILLDVKDSLLGCVLNRTFAISHLMHLYGHGHLSSS